MTRWDVIKGYDHSKGLNYAKMKNNGIVNGWCLMHELHNTKGTEKCSFL